MPGEASRRPRHLRVGFRPPFPPPVSAGFHRQRESERVWAAEPQSEAKCHSRRRRRRRLRLATAARGARQCVYACVERGKHLLSARESSHKAALMGVAFHLQRRWIF